MMPKGCVAKSNWMFQIALRGKCGRKFARGERAGEQGGFGYLLQFDCYCAKFLHNYQETGLYYTSPQITTLTSCESNDRLSHLIVGLQSTEWSWTKIQAEFIS